MFFFKRKKIVVDCFTSDVAVFNYSPVQKSVNFIPEWWKYMPKSHKLVVSEGIEVERATIKGCQGFIDLYKSGFMLPLWADLIIEVDPENWKYVFSDKSPPINWHNSAQMGRTFENYHHLKIESPWLFSEKTGVNFIFLQPSWNHIHYFYNFHAVPGVLNYNYQPGTAINMFVPKRNLRIEMNHHDPLAQIIPLSENDVEVKNHLVSVHEFARLSTISYETKFRKKYLNNKKILKQKETKCPFGFGNK
jgi:hypothetical protein